MVAYQKHSQKTLLTGQENPLLEIHWLFHFHFDLTYGSSGKFHSSLFYHLADTWALLDFFVILIS